MDRHERKGIEGKPIPFEQVVKRLLGQPSEAKKAMAKASRKKKRK